MRLVIKQWMWLRVLEHHNENNNTQKAGEFVKEKDSNTLHSHSSCNARIEDSNLGIVKLSEWRNLLPIEKLHLDLSLSSSLSFIKRHVNDFVKFSSIV